jgi:hypothetical protein
MRAVIFGLALGLAASPAAALKPRDLPLEPQRIEVRARQITAFHPGRPELRRFGALEWIGGLELSSDSVGFGGYSALQFTDAAGRRLLAVSDAGIWLQAELSVDGERPVGVAAARVAPMRDENGRSIAGTWRGDSESLALRGAEALVGFERHNVVRRFALSPDLLTSPGRIIPTPPGLRRLRGTRGLEALVVFPPGSPHPGALLGIGESPIRGETDHAAFIIGGRGGEFRIVHRDEYDVTDAAFLPSGDLVTLERRVQLPFGVWCRIRRFPAAALVPGARIDGRVIFEADLGAAIDNMEGLAVHRGNDGATYLTMISDDNFSILQRTLLLRFRLVE